MMNKEQPRLPPLLGLAIGLLAVSTASVFIRLGQQEAPSIVIAAGRLGIAALILLPFAWRYSTAELTGLNRRQWGWLVLAGFFLALHFAAWITSLEFTSIASSVVLVTTTPLWVSLFSPIFLKEKITRALAVGMLVAITGSVFVGLANACNVTQAGLVCSPWAEFFTGESLWGNILALVGAWMAAGYVMVGRKARSDISLLAYIFPVYATAAIVLIAGVFISGNSLLGYAPQTYIWFLLLALLPQIIGHTSYNWALGYLPAAFVSITLLGEPVGSVMLAMIMLAEAPSLFEIIGGVMILAGILISVRYKAKTPAGSVVSK